MSSQHGRGPGFDAESVRPGAVEPALPERIRHLVRGEPFAILSTQGEGQPYASIVAFAMTDDFHTAVFATPTATRKYRLLTACDRVALEDSRTYKRIVSTENILTADQRDAGAGRGVCEVNVCVAPAAELLFLAR